MKILSPFVSLFLIPLLVVLPVQAQVPASEPAAPSLHVVLKSRTTATVNSQTAAGFVVEVSDAKGAPVPDAAVAFRLPESGPTGTFSDGTHAAVVYTDGTGQAYSPIIHWGALPGSASLRITAVKGALRAGLLMEETLEPAAGVANAPAAKPPTPGIPISEPQVVIVTVPKRVAPPPLEPSRPALSPDLSQPTVSKPTTVTRSGAEAEPIAPKPAVSITNKPDVHPHSNKKWLLLALIGVGAGVGAALAMKGKGGATTAAPPPSTVSIGAPTVNVGH